jgi:hypothetical protein
MVTVSPSTILRIPFPAARWWSWYNIEHVGRTSLKVRVWSFFVSRCTPTSAANVTAHLPAVDEHKKARANPGVLDVDGLRWLQCLVSAFCQAIKTPEISKPGGPPSRRRTA